MTDREKAIKMLKSKIDGHTDTSYEWAETVRMAIKALEQDNCENCSTKHELEVNLKKWANAYRHGLEDGRKDQQLSEDCVSRKEAIRLAEQGQVQGFEWQIRKLITLSSVTPQPNVGRWIEESNDCGEITQWHCSNCYDDNGFISTCKWDYCPSCGAKMEVEQ